MQPDLVLSLCSRAFVVVGEGERELRLLFFTPGQPVRLYQGERVGGGGGERERERERERTRKLYFTRIVV